MDDINIKYRFYCENLDLAASCGQVELASGEAHHAVNVLRLKKGQIVELFDGAGRYCHGEIFKASKRSCIVGANEIFTAPEPPLPHICIASALPKQSRQDMMIEKLTELSVSSFIPLHCDHSSVKVSKGRDFLGRWSKLAISAARQSNRYWLPQFTAPVALDDVLEDEKFADPAHLCLFAHCDSSDSSENIPFSAIEFPSGVKSVTALIGPEGGWSPRELQLAANSTVKRTILGENILRIETASMAFASAILSRL